MKKPKSITKKITTRKRPKSVLRKAWATRRANAKLDKFWGVEKAEPANLPGIAGLAKATPTSETETRRSEAATAGGLNEAFEALARNNVMHRDEMLLGFMGDMSAMRRVTNSGHHPVMVSRAQAEAIESFLDEHGYSPWGRSTGSGGTSEVRKSA